MSSIWNVLGIYTFSVVFLLPTVYLTIGVGWAFSRIYSDLFGKKGFTYDTIYMNEIKSETFIKNINFARFLFFERPITAQVTDPTQLIRLYILMIDLRLEILLLKVIIRVKINLFVSQIYIYL